MSEPKPGGLGTAKKPYAAPVLREYGTIQQLTGNTGNTKTARGDGGPPGNKDKTR